MTYKRALALMRRRLGTPGGRNVALFMVFVCIALGLWVVTTLNEEQQRDLRYRVEVSGVPDSLTHVTDIPRQLTVTVRGRGSEFLRYDLRRDHVLNIDYRRWGGQDGRLRLTAQDLRALLAETLGTGTGRIVSFTPDSLAQQYTDHPGVTLPVRVQAAARVVPGYTLRGNVTPDLDSVTVYSLSPLPEDVRWVSTVPVTFDHLKGRTTRRVRLIAPAGTRVVPSSIVLTAQGEPLVYKRRTVNIDILDVPSDMVMVPFPAQVEVSYFVPTSMQGTVNPDFEVTATYADVARAGSGHKVALTLHNVPTALQGASMNLDSVPYILEHK